MNWAVYVAVGLLLAQWVLSVVIYHWVYGAWLQPRFAWAANGLLIFKWRAPRWEQRRPGALVTTTWYGNSSYYLTNSTTTSSNYYTDRKWMP